MDIRQIEYIVAIADEKGITRAAEKLFITQSALSQQLQKLEKELDAKLFFRNKNEWIPTPVGTVYLKNAREILRIKQRTYAEIADLVESSHGYLSIGMTPGRGPDMFSQVYPRFHDLFPDITVEPRELSVKRQQEEIRKGTLDLGFMTLTDSQKNGDIYLDLFQEELFLGIPEDYPLSKEDISTSKEELSTSKKESPYTEVSLKTFQYEPFVLMYKESTVRILTDQLFSNNGFSPKVLFETASNQTVLSMIRAHLCLGIIPEHYVRQNPPGVRFLRLPDHPAWTVSACYRKDAYLTNAARAFIQLVQEYWAY